MTIALDRRIRKTISSRDAESLARRMCFADSYRYKMDWLMKAAGRSRRMGSFQWSYYAATVIYDLLEAIGRGGRINRPGQAHLAALLEPVQIEQSPHYRAYWYDPQRHTMVGCLLGLDMHRYQEKYYLLECNLTAGLMPERRALYREPIDPFIIGIVDLARKHGFRKIVLHRRSWRPEHQREIAIAAAESKLEIVAASAMHEDGDPPVNPMIALPRQLEPDTLYVVCTAISNCAIFQFLHQKALLDVWLPYALATEPSGASRLLTSISSAYAPWIPEPLDDPRWPNVVVKLSNSDEGKDVLLGRFQNEASLRRALGLTAHGRGLPRAFTRRLDRWLISKLFPDAMTAVYQSFVPPEIVGRRPMMIRMETFISPLENKFLSAHGTLGGEELPDAIPEDVALSHSPFNVSVPPGKFVRLDSDIEKQLHQVANEFGNAAWTAIRCKFKIGPEDSEVSSDQRVSRERSERD